MVLLQVIPGQWHSVSVKRWHQDSILVLDSDPEVGVVLLMVVVVMVVVVGVAVVVVFFVVEVIVVVVAVVVT